MRFPRILSALLLASTLGACHSYQPVTTPLPEFVAAHDGELSSLTKSEALKHLD